MWTELQPKTVGFWTETDKRACPRANDHVHLLQEGALLLGDHTGSAHCQAPWHLLSPLSGEDFHPLQPSVSQLLTRPRDAGNNDNVQNILCQERPFPLGRPCVRRSVRTVPTVLSLDWLSWNLPLKWQCNKLTPVQLGSVDLEMPALPAMNCMKNCDVSKKSPVSPYLTAPNGKLGDRNHSISTSTKRELRPEVKG